MPRQPGHAGEHGRRGREDQAARARDDQHGDRPRPDVGPARQIAGQEGRAGHQLDHRQKVPRQPVGDFLQPGLAPPGLGDQPEHLAEGRLAADLLGVDLDRAELVDACR